MPLVHLPLRPHALVGLAGACLVSLTSADLASAQCDLDEDQELSDPSGAANHLFGHAVDVDGDVAVVGSTSAMGRVARSGAAFVYRHDGQSWQFEQKIFAGDGARGDIFGYSVTIEDELIAVGAYGYDSWEGAVYVFRFDGTSWSQDQKIHRNTQPANTYFGCSVSLDGDVLGIGAFGESNSSGTTYVYRHNGTRFKSEQIITEPVRNNFNQFGWFVSADLGTLLVGTPQGDGAQSDTGVAYVYRHDGTAYVIEQMLAPADGATSDGFGTGVSIDGARAVVGAPGDDGAGPDAGSAYVYHFDGATWNEQPELHAGDAVASGALGYAIDIDGDQMVAGAIGAEGAASVSGAAHAWRFNGTDWKPVAKLRGSVGDGGDLEGFATAISGDQVLVGAPLADGILSSTGTAYAFTLPDLTLEVSPAQPSPGDTLHFDCCAGFPGGRQILVVVDINGTPLFLKLLQGNFDTDGQWTFSATVPGGLSGLAVTFQSLGFFLPGKVGQSNPALVDFQ